MAEKLSIKQFMRNQLSHEEKLLRKDIRKIKGYLSNIEDMRRTMAKATEEDMVNLIKRDPEVYAAYEESQSLLNMSYEEWEDYQIKLEAENTENQGVINE